MRRRVLYDRGMSANVDPVIVRPARIGDLPRLTEIYNHYVVETPTTFDLEPFTVEQRTSWFERYGATGRYRLLVAEEGDTVIAYTSSSPFHARHAYDTTVETTIFMLTPWHSRPCAG